MSGSARVSVMGGSLGGLTAALVLRDIGCDVSVYERSRVPLEGRGAGIVLHPATVRYFLESGTVDVGAMSTKARLLRYVDRDGSPIHEQPCRYLFTSYYALHGGLLRCFGTGDYHLDSEVRRLHAHDDEIVLELTNGRSIRSDLAVCADGIHSTARAQLLPDSPRRYAGYVGWRGTVGRSDLSAADFSLLRDSITYFVGRNTHILTYPIPDLDGSVDPGRVRINFVWYVNVAPEDLEDLMVDRDGVARSISLGAGMVQERHLEALRERAEQALPPAIAATVSRAEEPFVQAVYDVEVTRMAVGRACLLGDAAFAIRPHAAAGTAKAAEDAWELARALLRHPGDIPEALQQWESSQLRLGRRVLQRARDIGERSQFLGTYVPGDQYLLFGLHEAGDSSMPQELLAPG